MIHPAGFTVEKSMPLTPPCPSILIRANHISVGVAITAAVVVVVVVVAVGSHRSSTDRCRTVSRTSIGTAIGRAPIDPGAGDWTGHVSVSSGMVSPGPPMDTAAASIAAAPASASQCIIGNQTCDDKNGCG